MKARLISLILALAALMLCSCSFDTGNPPPAKSTDVPENENTAGGSITVQDVSPGRILDYFNEVALGSEYGESTDVLCKWTKTVLYTVEGSATEDDLTLIGELCERLNTIEGFPGIRKAIIPGTANFVISFVENGKIEEMFEAADGNCVGMAEYSWDSSTGEILSARAAIDETITDERCSTVCEEFLQALGPACDSYSYINSVFYEGVTLVPRPSELDWAIMQILYSPEMPVGVHRADALAAAARLVSWETEE